MIAEWKTFLANAGAVIQDGRVEHFGDPQKERDAMAAGNIVTDLSSLALIRVGGDDAATFLQGQLTNDIRLLDESRSQLSAYCDPKGRMLAIFRLFMGDNAYMLQLPASLQDSIINRLRVHVLRSKVTVEPAKEELQCIGLAGPDAEAIMQTQTGFVPMEKESCVTRDSLTAMRVAGVQPRFEIVGPLDALRQLWDRINHQAVAVGTSAWTWLEIMAGVPNVYPQTSGAIVPQMANLELLDGVNFEKGCYSGQEIIARLHHRGKVKQRMYRSHVTIDEIPEPGDAIYASDLRGQATGMVVHAAASPEGGHDMLAVIHSSSVASGDLHLGSEQGPALTIEKLPYRLVS
ncbi:MAG: YgfZ/GcvT domain-containing protein [Acidiferrobacterales bacterium]